MITTTTTSMHADDVNDIDISVTEVEGIAAYLSLEVRGAGTVILHLHGESPDKAADALMNKLAGVTRKQQGERL